MQSVQRLWGEKFIKVWYNKSYAAGRFPYNDKNEGMHMANGIIFLVGALIMFYMALRSVRQRRSLCTNGEKVQARITGTVQSRDGTAYVLEFTTAGGSHRLQYPKPSRSKDFAEGSVVTLYYDPEAPEKMYVEGDKSVLGAEALYAGTLFSCDRALAGFTAPPEGLFLERPSTSVRPNETGVSSRIQPFGVSSKALIRAESG